MQTRTTQQVQIAFDDFLDIAQVEPVLITEDGRDIALMLPIQHLPVLVELADNIRTTIKAGVLSGIKDAEAGRTTELTDSYIAQLKNELRARLEAS